jgi:hypothetical protein
MSELKKLRREWKAQIKDMTEEQIWLSMHNDDDVFLYIRGDKERCIVINGINEKPLGYNVSDLATDKEMRLPPWHLLNAAKLPEREIVVRGSENDLTQRAYSIIWKNWKSYLNAETPENTKLSVAVKIARENITTEMCPWYPTTFPRKIWDAALLDLSRKMHDGYIPVNSKGEELWDSKY